jgi:hypothetical protein
MQSSYYWLSRYFHESAVSGEPRQRVQHTAIQPRLQYDDVDRRLMDTFPASDAVARY